MPPLIADVILVPFEGSSLTNSLIRLLAELNNSADAYV
jgi:hypothetical protein